MTIAVNTQLPGAAIPTNFLGLSFEEDNLQPNGVGVNGYMFDSSNAQMVTLFTNLGIKSLRIGGISVDTNNIDIPQYMPTNQDIDALFRFAAATGLNVVLSLRLENGNPQQDAALAGYTWTNYNRYLTSFAMGNEPDNYGSGDPQITNFTSYLAKWNRFAAIVTNAVPQAKFGGPDSAGTTWAGEFANAQIGSPIVTAIYSHFYVGGESSGLTAAQVISGLLSSNWDVSSDPSHLNATQAIANADGFPFRSTEFNSYVAALPGVAGGNNSFASSLFAVDAAHWQAAHGASGLNFHTFLGKYNATFYYDANGNYQIYPVAYGIKAYDVGGHGSNMPVTITNSTGLNVTAYAVGQGTNLYVTIVNKDTNGPNAAVTIQAQGFVTGTVKAMYLTDPGGVGSTNGVTLGGAYITNNAAWAGQWTALPALTNGQCVLTVTNATAAIVLIQAATVFAPPVITGNLPPAVRVASGRPYEYTVTALGGQPLSYQWYQNSARIAGATGSTLFLTTGAVGSSSNYSVVVSNSYGVVTSSVSSLSVVAVPQVNDFYAKTILGYGPVGYWPLQETSAPAPGNWEANYGTLGALGNAYYACTNAGSAVFSEPGAIAGDPDPCVLLLGGSANPNSYAFVPRLTTNLTITAPFSLEAWVKMDNNTYGLAIGEGGGTGLNGGPNFGGFQFGEGVQTYGNQFQMNYFTGSGNNQSQEQENNYFFSLNQWYHYVATYDGFNSTLYVDGQDVWNATTSYSPDTWSPLAIGGGKWDYGPICGLRWFQGMLDEVAIYTNVLSPTAVANHYQAGISASSNYFQTVINDGPELYYRMDCPAFTVAPTSLFPSAFNFGTSPVIGTYPSGIVPGGISGPPIGVLGANSVAAPINGVVSCVDAGFDPNFNPTGTQPFTVMTWFRTYPSDGRTQALMSHGGASSWSLRLMAASGGQVMWSSGAGLVVSTNALNDGNWHFVAGVYDGVNNYLYVDGALNNSGPATQPIAGNVTDDLYLGGDPDYTQVGNNEQYFAGALAQAAYFTNALGAGQIQSIYNVAVQVSAVLLSPQMSGYGVFSFVLTSPAGSTCVIQTSTDLTNWNALQTITNQSGSTTIVQGVGTNANTYNYYRAVVLP